ncbi:MAG: hypothetical protein WB699_02470 [Bacteroidota bacterium]
MSFRSAMLFLPVLFLVAAMDLHAQVVVSEHGRETSMGTNVFGLGFAGGPASGLGLSFRHHLPSAASYELVGGIIKATDRLFYSVGAEFQYDLSRSSVIRFYAAAGVAYFYSGVSGHNDMDAPTRVGAGIGLESTAGSGFHVNGDLLFTYFSDGTVLPLPQIGVHYYFF